MKELMIAAVELIAYLLAAIVLTGLGAVAEWTSLSYFVAGNYVFGAWLVAMGGLALYAGVVGLGAEKVLPRYRRLLNSNLRRE